MKIGNKVVFEEKEYYILDINNEDLWLTNENFELIIKIKKNDGSLWVKEERMESSDYFLKLWLDPLYNQLTLDEIYSIEYRAIISYANQ